MTVSRTTRIAAVAAACVLAGVTLNPWVLRSVFSVDGVLDPATWIKILAADGLLIGSGLLLWMLRARLDAKVLAVNVLLLITLLALAEGTIGVLLHTSVLTTGRLHALGRELYLATMDAIQYLPECAQYDPDLGYRLRPGDCRFENLEFSTDVAVNSRGLRDHEDDLVAPEIIVLGDSHAMGWGVEHHETFPELQRITGRKVLNAAISSYGTVRALKLLRRLDRDSLRVLVIQHCDNDHAENQTFYEHGHLPVMDAQRYETIVSVHAKQRQYVFGEYLFRAINRRLIDPPAFALARTLHPGYAPPRRRPPPPAPLEARHFLHALRHAPVPLGGLRIIVLEINSFGLNDGHFLDALAVQHGAAFPPAPPLDLLDVSPLLTSAHYYPLDGHMRAEGHAIVAEALAARLQETMPAANARP